MGELGRVVWLGARHRPRPAREDACQREQRSRHVAAQAVSLLLGHRLATTGTVDGRRRAARLCRVMTEPTTAAALGERFVAALAARDGDGLAAVLHPAVDFR